MHESFLDQERADQVSAFQELLLRFGCELQECLPAKWLLLEFGVSSSLDDAVAYRIMNKIAD